MKETINALHANGGVDHKGTKKLHDGIVKALTESKGRVGGPDGAAARMGVKRTTLLARSKSSASIRGTKPDEGDTFGKAALQ